MDAVEKIQQVLSNKDTMHVMFILDMDVPTFRDMVKSLEWGYVYVHIPKQESLLFHFAHDIYAYVPELTERMPYAYDVMLNACRNTDNRPALEMFLHSVLRELDNIKPFVIHIAPIDNILGCEDLLSVFRSLNLNRRYKNLKIVAIADKNILFNSELNMFKQEIIMDSNMLKGFEVSNEKKKVFVSYSWKEPSNHIVENNLQTAFQRNEIDYELDKNDCDYRANIPAFEERIGKGEYVVAVVSDAYVHSIQCMYEMACVFENGEVNKRLFPLYFDDVKRSDEEYYNELVGYWRKKIIDIQAQSSQMGEPENILYKTDLIYLEKIQKYIGDFFVYLRSTNTRSLTELGKDGFKKLVEQLGVGPISPVLETTNVQPEMSSPTSVPTINVYGGQVNINSDGGSMTVINGNCFNATITVEDVIKYLEEHKLLECRHAHVTTDEEVFEEIKKICSIFKDLVEKNRMSSLFYRQGRTPDETDWQLLLFAIARTYAKASNGDYHISREDNPGPGEIDLHFTRGRKDNVCVELKVSGNGNIVHGYEEQLKGYMMAEDAKRGIYMVVLQDNQHQKDINHVMQKAQEYKDFGEDAPEVIIVDGRKQLSASQPAYVAPKEL